MATPPDLLAGLAPRDAIPHFKSGKPLGDLRLGPEEGFVLSRVDGNCRLGDLLNLVPFPPERTVGIIRRLWLAGAIDIPGYPPPIMTETKKTTGPYPMVAPATSSVPPGVDLTLEQVQTIDAFFVASTTKDAFALLDVPRTADKKEIKRAYFKLSKEFHPDRFFGKSLGPYAERLTQIFQALKSSFELLSDDTRRMAYLDSITA